ncbi:MAG TPA: GNAT family N-acetyltransferase [Pseudonocardiaceae bacterium]
MNTTTQGPPTEAVRAQAARFAALDPLLPPYDGELAGDLITAVTPAGEPVYGLRVVNRLSPDNVARLWAAAETESLTPLIGDTGTAGMGALLGAWAAVIAQAPPSADSACVVTWPSHDIAATRAFLDHGLVPAVVVAVHTSLPAVAPEPPEGLVVRRAGTTDYQAVIDLALAELEYSSHVGAAAPANGADLRTDSVLRRLADGGPMWLAVRDGEAVGLADCGWADVAPGEGYARQLRPGRWGYVNCLSVLTEARGRGVGAALVAAAHAEFARGGARGSFLFYTPANPLSSVFWPRRGYRPLWTMWETRPATTLR